MKDRIPIRLLSRVPGMVTAPIGLAVTLMASTAAAQPNQDPGTQGPEGDRTPVVVPVAEQSAATAPEPSPQPVPSIPEPPQRVDLAPPVPATVRQSPPPPRSARRGGVRPSAPWVGPPLKYTLESIEVHGNERTRSRVVLRFVPFAQGDVINVDDPRIELSRYRLLGTGFFRDVQFSLRKGARRGSVVLVITVVERNTVVVNDVWMGLSADADTRGRARPLTTYAGLDLAETNLAGTGMTLGAALGIAQDQFALRVRHLDPAFLATQWMVSSSLLYNDANDFFGNARVLSSPRVSNFAVVQYRRFGGSLGAGRDLSVATQLWAHYRLESIDATPPLAASHLRGGEREPILFDIVRGQSVLSSVRGTLQYDTRDHPFLPTRGWFGTFTGELALEPLGSNYEYERVDVSASRWWPLPWSRHVIRLELFAGAIIGDAPFFEQYYVGDLSDFLPARVLGLNLDRRPSPNFLGTAIEEVRYGHYALKVGAEYRIPLYRGYRSVYGIDFFGSAGVFALAHRHDLESPPRSYSGAARVPADLTANLGFRMDTSVGGVSFSFANVLGFVPVRWKW